MVQRRHINFIVLVHYSFVLYSCYSFSYRLSKSPISIQYTFSSTKGMIEYVNIYSAINTIPGDSQSGKLLSNEIGVTQTILSLLKTYSLLTINFYYKPVKILSIAKIPLNWDNQNPHTSFVSHFAQFKCVRLDAVSDWNLS